MKMRDVIHLTHDNSGEYKLDREATRKAAIEMLKKEIPLGGPEHVQAVTDTFMGQIDLYLIPVNLNALAILIQRDDPSRIREVLIGEPKAKKKKPVDIDYTQVIKAANEAEQPIEIGEMQRVVFVNTEPPTPAIVDDLTKPEES